MTVLAIGIAIGVILKILVPMPWADDPVRAAWAYVYDLVGGWLK